MRGGTVWGVPPPPGGVGHLYHIFNHGKRSVAIDLKHERGHEALLRLVETSDVFLTSFLSGVRRRLRIDVDDVRAAKPDIVYARNTGRGTRGPSAELGGFDATSFWSRAGLAAATSTPDQAVPTAMPAPAFGDSQTGFALGVGGRRRPPAPGAHGVGHRRRHVAPQQRHVGHADGDRHRDHGGPGGAAPSAAGDGRPARELLPHQGRPARPPLHGPGALLALVLRRRRPARVEGRPRARHPRGPGGEQRSLRAPRGGARRRADPRRVEGRARHPARPLRPRAEGGRAGGRPAGRGQRLPRRRSRTRWAARCAW